MTYAGIYSHCLTPPLDASSYIVLADGTVMEGLTSNVFAIINGSVYTAKEGVLLGTVRNLILKVCEENDIPVVESPPNISNVSTWQGCIVSSTSRLALPVAQVQLCAKDGTVSRQHTLSTEGTDNLAAKIDALVLGKIEACSEALA